MLADRRYGCAFAAARIHAALQNLSATGLPVAGTTLGPNQSTSAQVAFSPSAAGPASGRLTIASSAGPVTVELSGEGASHSPPALLVSAASSLHFATTTVGETASLPLVLSNGGGTLLTFRSYAGPAAPFAATGLPPASATLAPGQSLQINAEFSPGEAGTFSGSLSIDSSGGTLTLSLSGTAAAKAEVAPPPRALARTGGGCSSTGANGLGSILAFLAAGRLVRRRASVRRSSRI